MQTVIIASGNKGKLKEFQELMKDLRVEVRSLADYPEIGDIEENGTTFAENAYIKAKAVHDATGCLAIADDSGLEVDALGGARGSILRAMRARKRVMPKTTRSFSRRLRMCRKANAARSSIARSWQFLPTAAALTQKALCVVRSCAPARGENGFGYDPLFYVREFDKTTAELSMDEKNAISHRGQAVRKIVAILKENVFLR